jgi:hypothetical protein
MAVVLKRATGEAGAYLDSSAGDAKSTLHDVLKALVDAHQETVAQFNLLRTSVTGASAFPITTTAAALTSKVTAE